ncbi:type II toxin-antitoxin system RelE/ParE family toxin [Candidatus Amarobacter glycogenicus]|uniref:type II toxin-antitoxin system RelE/ParE family toxin n=1 Tax=Candidatus Amarobacter glycogenicus TaxID=3140699 RepID=UPI003135054F|nr:type II toxin-antitoxin system RelE/ParE family toxin [Dehalococcoidia bacterium]
MKSLWTPEAEGELDKIVARLNAFSEGSGDRFADRLYERVKNLEHSPFLGRRVPEFESAFLRELIHRGYRVFYEAFPDRIEIFAIRHGRQSVPVDDGD